MSPVTCFIVTLLNDQILLTPGETEVGAIAWHRSTDSHKLDFSAERSPWLAGTTF